MIAFVATCGQRIKNVAIYGQIRGRLWAFLRFSDISQKLGTTELLPRRDITALMLVKMKKEVATSWPCRNGGQNVKGKNSHKHRSRNSKNHRGSSNEKPKKSIGRDSICFLTKE